MRPDRPRQGLPIPEALAAAVLVLLFGLGAIPTCARPLLLSVIEAGGAPVSGAVATINGPATRRTPALPLKAVMDQVGLKFEPAVLVVPVGSQISFPNSDSVSHQVYSFSQAKRFQLPLYRGKPYPPVQFSVPGLVTLGCNIHDAMIGYIVVTDARHFGKTNGQGAFQTEDLEPGEYELLIWHPRLRDAQQPIRKRIIINTDETAIELTVDARAALRPKRDFPGRADWDSY